MVAVGIVVSAAIGVHTISQNADGVQDNRGQIISIITRLAAAEAQGKLAKVIHKNKFIYFNC